MDLFRYFGSRTKLFASLLVAVVLLGTVLFHQLEDWTWIQSFYFTIVTLATVGYGDLAPTSDSTRLASAIFIIFGLLVVVSLLSVMEMRFIQKHPYEKLRDEIKKINRKS